MLRNLRRRIAGEHGISLVEMMVALFMLSVGMLGLLSTFTASAKSVLEQRAKAAATRVASQELEELRPKVWDPTFVAPAACPAVRDPVPMDGRDYCVNTTITDSVSPPGLKTISTEVVWYVGGDQRSATSTTAVSSGTAMPDTLPTDAAITVEMSPNPVRVFESGAYWSPSTPVTISLNVVNYTYAGQMQVTWTNADGSPGGALINKSGDTWTYDIPPAELIVEYLDPLQLEGFMVFNVQAVSEPALSSSYSLATLGYDDVSLTLEVASNGSEVILLNGWNQGQLCGTATSTPLRCVNRHTVYFWTTNVPPEATEVLLTWPYPANGATTYSVALQPYPGYPGLWYDDVAPGEKRFNLGTASSYSMPSRLTVKDGPVLIMDQTLHLQVQR